MSLRIIGGIFRNRPLKTPKSETTRPTLAVMRKAVFDILQNFIEGADFLDLFAGSGAMGFEAISRGAAHATFVESSKEAFRCIEENMRILQVQNQSTLLSYDALLSLKKLEKAEKQFDVVYIDPPYAAAAKKNLLEEILLFLDTHALLRKGARVFLEEAKPSTLATRDLSLNALQFMNSRTFSHSMLHQFCKK